MVDRVAATQATLDRFRDKSFTWGETDCAKIAAWHLRQFGYTPPLAKAGAYKTALGARGALRRLGFASVAEALDAMGMERVTPAAAWVGDIVMGESGDPFGAFGIYLGNDAMLGHHEHASGATVLRRVHLAAVWRVLVQ